MFPFDLPSETTLTLLIPIVLILYAVILIKLKPKTESEIQPNKLRTGTVEVITGQDVVKSHNTLVGMRKNLDKESTPASQTAPTVKTLTKNSQPEINARANMTPKVKDDKKKKKSFLLYGEADFEGCNHSLGHLKALPKNTPIPDECFGCPEILECIKHSNNKPEVESSVTLG